MKLRKPLALFRVWDVLLIVILLALVVLTLVFALAPAEGDYAEIYLNGEKVATLPLDRAGEWSNEHLKVVVEGGSVRVEDADCPDRICQRRGAISRAGDSIVCLPNKVVVRIAGEGEVEAIS